MALTYQPQCRSLALPLFRLSLSLPLCLSLIPPSALLPLQFWVEFFLLFSLLLWFDQEMFCVFFFSQTACRVISQREQGAGNRHSWAGGLPVKEANSNCICLLRQRQRHWVPAAVTAIFKGSYGNWRFGLAKKSYNTAQVVSHGQ